MKQYFLIIIFFSCWQFTASSCNRSLAIADTIPFANIVSVSGIELSQKVQFSPLDSLDLQDSFVLVFIKLRTLTPFLSRGIKEHDLMFNDSPVRYLWFPGTRDYLTFIAPLQDVAPDKSDIWLLPNSHYSFLTEPEVIRSLRKQTREQMPHHYIALGRTQVLQNFSSDIVSISDFSELLQYAEIIERSLKN